MRFKIYNDKLEIMEPRIINSGSIAYYLIDCEFDENWNSLIKKAILIKKGESTGTQIAVIGNQIYIDKNTFGDYYVGFVGYTLNNDNQKILQISTNLKGFYIDKGAGEIQVMETEVPPISEWEIYVTQLENISNIATAKIQEMLNLEESVEQAERDRATAEEQRVENENARQNNESTRQENEQTRQSQEESRERRTDEAIGNIQDKTAEYNANAEDKINVFNQNATDKTSDFNSNATNKTTSFNNNAVKKTNDFDANYTQKVGDFNGNATSKTNDFNDNVSDKTITFNNNAENKTTEFNTNASDKTTAFNNNATTKTTAFNTNATNKTNTFNSNVQNKTNEALSILDSEIARITDGQIEIDPNAEIIQARHGFTNLNQAVERRVFYFPNISEMKSCTPLSVGDAVRTLGYYSANDGGGSYYYIRNTMQNDSPDDATLILLSNNLIAEMIVENNTIDIRQFGYVANNPSQDCHDSIQQYVNVCNRNNTKYKLFIPSGIWCFSETNVANPSNVRMGVWIEGVSHNFNSANNNSKDSVIVPFNNNQDFIWNLGLSPESTTIVGGNTLHNLMFSSAPTNNIGYSNKFVKIGLLLTYCCYSHFDSIYFFGIRGTALTIRVGFENYWGFLNFRGVGYITHAKTYHAFTIESHPVSGMASAVSANYFDYINFEGWCGSALFVEVGSNFVHSEFNNIQAEWNIATGNIEEDYTLQWTKNADDKGITWNNPDNKIEHMYLIKGAFATNNNGIQFNTISISGCNRELYTVQDIYETDVRYLVRSGIFGPYEHYEDCNFGLNVMCSKLSMVSRTKDFPVFHAINLYRKNDINCCIGILQGCEKPFWINNNGARNIFTVSKSLDKFDNYNKIFFGNNIPSIMNLVSIGDGSGVNNLVYGGGVAGSLSFNYNASKPMYLRMFVKCDDISELPNNIQVNCTITRKNGSYQNMYCCVIPKSDFENNIYPVNQWFDYCLTDYNSQYYPFNDINFKIWCNLNNCYFDYIFFNDELRKLPKNLLLNGNIVNYSKTGSTAYCTDLDCIATFNGTNWLKPNGDII